MNKQMDILGKEKMKINRWKDIVLEANRLDLAR